MEYIWDKACSDTAWWRDELEENALLVLTRTSTLSTMVDGDAAITHHGGAAQLPRASPPPPPAVPPYMKGGALKLINPKDTKVPAHNVDEGGFYKTNRKEHPLCGGLQNGTCTNTVGSSVFCAADSAKVHQCRKCLSPTHGSDVGSGCPSQPKVPKGPKPQGKGKGNGKGKGWGKRQWTY